MICHIRRAAATPDLSAPFEAWSNCETMLVDHPAPGNWPYRPDTRLRLQYDDRGLYGLFQVRDSAVRCVRRHFQDGVCNDSCVEIFLMPMHGVGYSNFEISASGVMLTMHIEDETRTGDGFKRFRYLTEEEVKDVRIYHTLPDCVPEEITVETTYRVGFFLPFSLFTAIYGAPVPRSGTVWRGNAYKCGDETSKPHYLSWNPIDEVNFHLPRCFGELVFD
ncbi:MAG: carbohydrate-binding family 9-like protein [Lentisphaeria bacterium]|nr:carbohydrate-binding family 9-like protein [Lentisphaeria bacterium]